MAKPTDLTPFRIPPGKKIRLKDYDTGWMSAEGLTRLGKGQAKQKANAKLEQYLAKLSNMQQLL